MPPLISIILAPDDATRNQSLDSVCHTATLPELLSHCASLDNFRRSSDNLYHRVRSLFFLANIYRYYIPPHLTAEHHGFIPFAGYEQLLERRFPEAIDAFLACQRDQRPNESICSALAQAYHQLGFQTLADQVRRSVRTVRGNNWMFRIGHPDDHPLRFRPELLERRANGPFPILAERTAVRMDFSHSAWSDIFFLGMDFPEGARVLNASVDLGVRGRDPHPRPPIETYLRVIDEPVLRLVSIDLKASTDIQNVSEVFDFARDYLGLLKAAVIAAGLVPPGMEGSEHHISALLDRLVAPGLGLELVSQVNGIPKGSRLAVSTNLLGSLISNCMRATGQISTLTGVLAESDRRIVAARSILGEWLGGSGGGWQDSGGIWPGIKLIAGATATEGDPEFGISRGRLLPQHQVLGEDQVTRDTHQKLQESLVLVHGGMAQNVGPILEMVTEKYLLRSETEWLARQEAMQILDDVVDALCDGDVQRIGNVTTRNFTGPLQAIIPWATNLFTDTLIDKARSQYQDRFWGFWMLGGMSGGGMGFMFDPQVHEQAQDWLAETMLAQKQQLERTLPFAMDPVVYDFQINDRGTWAELRQADEAAMPDSYYLLLAPGWLRQESRTLPPQTRWELQRLGGTVRNTAGGTGSTGTGTTGLGTIETGTTRSDTASQLLEQLLPKPVEDDTRESGLTTLLDQFGFDHQQHEQIRADQRNGRIGLAQNRLAANTTIEDVQPTDVIDMRGSLSRSTSGGEGLREGASGADGLSSGSSADGTRSVPATLGRSQDEQRTSMAAHTAEPRLVELGEAAIRAGEVLVVSLAAGAGSRWTEGAGVVKALHPFCKLDGRHRNFLEVHLAKTRQVARQFDTPIPHVFTTGYLTDQPIRAHLAEQNDYGLTGDVRVSPSRSVGLRTIPMVHDLRFEWEEMPQQMLDEQQEKVRTSLRAALLGWAEQMGEGEDYTDNEPLQCLHPVGHWYEVPNMLRNGVLGELLRERPQLKYILLHNIDTLGANIDPALLGTHIDRESCLSFEVIPRRLEDRGGGLARVDGKVRLVEGLALPREEDEFQLSYYNSMTTWISIDRLLSVFHLSRADLSDPTKVDQSVRHLSRRLPTYITIKEVKKRWGHGQEDVYPVSQFEKLWSDMTALSQVSCSFLVVPTRRGQQLKQQSQLDSWLRDGSAHHLQTLCTW